MIDGEHWLNWWGAGFVSDIHESWHTLPWFSFSKEERQMLYQESPSAICALCQIKPSKIPNPEERVLKIIDLSPMRLQGMLRLIAALSNGDYEHLHDLDKEWCERISKAIRPETFLPTGVDFREPPFALAILQKIFLPAVWARLRLRFYQDHVLRSEEEAEAFSVVNRKRLRALIDAAIWRMESR
ncbi:hypothetical protein C1Y41_04265 [Pantoea sp. ICBG 1758]|uniref:hypothetical protein n=1 Tax=Pantoea sp. ICBG 1758 TaxID=2071682 RepID=UPI000CE3CB7C|nr:hypothetical protein [Pantoea sp. ICBG 1758]PPC63866.1 hypothetical protein C1Y41_04265 [Pantoea sp. ICBG 1758]